MAHEAQHGRLPGSRLSARPFCAPRAAGEAAAWSGVAVAQWRPSQGPRFVVHLAFAEGGRLLLGHAGLEGASWALWWQPGSPLLYSCPRGHGQLFGSGCPGAQLSLAQGELWASQWPAVSAGRGRPVLLGVGERDPEERAPHPLLTPSGAPLASQAPREPDRPSSGAPWGCCVCICPAFGLSTRFRSSMSWPISSRLSRESGDFWIVLSVVGALFTFFWISVACVLVFSAGGRGCGGDDTAGGRLGGLFLAWLWGPEAPLDLDTVCLPGTRAPSAAPVGNLLPWQLCLAVGRVLKGL